jgi:hypothetical protein
MNVQHLKMLGAATGACGLSGIIWLMPNGAMGGALGGCLALGAIRLSNQELRQKSPARFSQILFTGFIFGLIGGILMAAISASYYQIHGLPDYHGDKFGPPVIPFWIILVNGIFYGPAILWGYSTRSDSSRPLRRALLSTCGICFALKTISVVVVNPLHFKAVSDAAEYALLSAVPFALAWVVAMECTDPAWAKNSTAAIIPGD